MIGRGRFAAQMLAGRLMLVLGLAVAGCSDQPAVAPLLPGSSGSAAVDLRFVAGPLMERSSTGARGAAQPCEPAPTGFPAHLSGRVVITDISGATTTTAFEIPARTELTTVNVEGLAPGNGYRAEVNLNEGFAPVFSGESSVFAVLPGGRTVVGVDLLPQDRRAVIGLGPATLVAADEIAVPIYAANSLAVRGIEFDLCFDPEVLIPGTAQPMGPRATGFRAAGGEPNEPGRLRAVLWSEEASAAIGPGADPVLELRFRFQESVTPGTISALVFLTAIVTDAPANPSFAVYYFDGQVQR
jgi:hypothetical protein